MAAYLAGLTAASSHFESEWHECKCRRSASVHEDEAQEANRHLSRSHSANDLAQVSILLCIVANLFAPFLIFTAATLQDTVYLTQRHAI